MKQPSSNIALSHKQTFQQHIHSEDESLHSPKSPKLQPRLIQSHKRAYSSGVMGEFLNPLTTRTRSRAMPNIFRSNGDADDIIPTVTLAQDFITGSSSPKSLFVECSNYHHPILRCFSEPMDRESLPSHMEFPSSGQVAPLVLSFSGDSEATNMVAADHKTSPHRMIGSLLNVENMGNQTTRSYDPDKIELIYSSPTNHHRAIKLAPFDWTDAPVITRMKLYENSRGAFHEGPSHFPPFPSLITPEKDIDTDPYPYNGQLDEFKVKVEPVQSFLAIETQMKASIEGECDESTIASDLLPFSLPDVIDPYRRSSVGNISPLTTPNCDMYE